MAKAAKGKKSRKNTYLSNPRLKRAGVVHSYTALQLEEYQKCSADVEYFARTYFKIIVVDRGLQNFVPRDFQMRMIRQFVRERFSIVKMPRQYGKSTTFIAYILWVILFTDAQSVAILAHKAPAARKLLASLKLAYEHLPRWLQQGVVTWNKGNIELENNSKVIAASTASSSARGDTYNVVVLDEYAFVPRNIADDFFASVYPTITSGETTKNIIVSTPNGMNHYYKAWQDAVHGRSSYVPIEIGWRDIPGRDDAWRDRTIANIGIKKWRSEFGCEFLGSVSTLIDASKLSTMPFRVPVPLDRFGLDGYIAEPVEGRQYVMMVDVAEGVDQDSSAMVVVDVTEAPYRVVAKWCRNDVPWMMLPDIVLRYARHFNDAYVMVENNDIGAAVVESLHDDLEYDNVVGTVSTKRGQQVAVPGVDGSRTRLGVKMSKQIKSVGCANLKDLIEGDKLIVEDADIIEQLSNFVAKGRSFAAAPGEHDDLVMALVQFGWLSRQTFFRELTDTDVRAKLSAERLAIAQSEILPAPVITDGREDEDEVPEAVPLGGEGLTEDQMGLLGFGGPREGASEG